MKIRILISDDHAVVRDSLAHRIEQEPDFEIVGLASTGKETLELYKKHKPDVMIVDIKLPDKSGLEIIDEIRRSDKETKILILTMYDNISYLRNALKAGVNGYLFKMSSVHNLINSIKTVLMNNTVLDESAAKLLVQPIEEIEKEKLEVDMLTSRELEILKLLAKGNTSREIAKELSISQYTVENHRKNMLRKTDFKNTNQLIQYFNSQDLL